MIFTYQNFLLEINYVIAYDYNNSYDVNFGIWSLYFVYGKNKLTK